MKKPYKEKENYVAHKEHPYDWIDHPSAYVMRLFSEYIHGHVLDFGCGTGVNSYLAYEIDNVYRVTGFDINEKALEIARKTKTLKGFENYDVNFFAGDIMEINIPRTYDTIISFHVIEHIYPEDIEYVLGKLYKSLEKGGYFIVSIPYERGYYTEEHVAFYNVETLKNLFEKCNFETIKCIYQQDLGQVLTGIFKKN